MILGASCHWRSDFARFVVLTRPDAFADVAKTLDLGMDRPIRASLISKSTAIVANDFFNLGAFASINWSDVLLKLATLESFACDGLVGIKPDRISVVFKLSEDTISIDVDTSIATKKFR